MGKKNPFAQYSMLSNDSSATLNAFFLQSQMPYKSILHCPWRCSLVQVLDFVLVFKEKKTFLAELFFLSWPFSQPYAHSEKAFFCHAFFFSFCNQNSEEVDIDISPDLCLQDTSEVNGEVSPSCWEQQALPEVLCSEEVLLSSPQLAVHEVCHWTPLLTA